MLERPSAGTLTALRASNNSQQASKVPITMRPFCRAPGLRQSGVCSANQLQAPSVPYTRDCNAARAKHHHACFDFLAGSFPWGAGQTGTEPPAALQFVTSSKEIKVNRILASAFASTGAAVISIGATASGNAYAQPLHIQDSAVNPTVEPVDSNLPEIKTAKPLPTQDSGSAYFGSFGEIATRAARCREVL
jgi:hypothetical protein